MDSKAVLEKAIQKAIDGGWVNYEDYKPVDLGAGDVGLEYAGSAVVLPHCMIFNQQFAKALWGEEMVDAGMLLNLEYRHPTPAYRWHLQQMVIADDPIKYLGDNLPKEER